MAENNKNKNKVQIEINLRPFAAAGGECGEGGTRCLDDRF